MSSNYGSPSDRSTTATTNAVESSKAGHGRGQCGVCGRGRQASQTPAPYSRPSFIGGEPTLKHDIFDYQETQQARKYRDNIEVLKIYIGQKHRKYTAELVSSLDTLTLSIPEELALLTETSPSLGALKMGIGLQEKRGTTRNIPQLPSQFLRIDLGSMYPCIV